jgi:hypothetical protein
VKEEWLHFQNENWNCDKDCIDGDGNEADICG